MKALQKNVNFRVLTDEETCSVTGGASKQEIGQRVIIGSGAVAIAGLISAFGCEIASMTYAIKAGIAAKKGDRLKADELTRSFKNTSIAATSLAGAALAVVGVGVGVGLSTGGLKKTLDDANDFLEYHNFI